LGWKSEEEEKNSYLKYKRIKRIVFLRHMLNNSLTRNSSRDICYFSGLFALTISGPSRRLLFPSFVLTNDEQICVSFLWMSEHLSLCKQCKLRIEHVLTFPIKSREQSKENSCWCALIIKLINVIGQQKR
jgi:hypothetical protein